MTLVVSIKYDFHHPYMTNSFTTSIMRMNSKVQTEKLNTEPSKHSSEPGTKRVGKEGLEIIIIIIIRSQCLMGGS